MANEFHVVDRDEAEEADFVVCIKATVKTAFTDQCYDFCADCGEKVQFRPHTPKIPKKLCYDCAMPKVKESMAKGDYVASVSPEGADIIRKYLNGRN